MKTFDEQGFLPLPHQLDRLDLKGYGAFYASGQYPVGSDQMIPGVFRVPQGHPSTDTPPGPRVASAEARVAAPPVADAPNAVGAGDKPSGAGNNNAKQPAKTSWDIAPKVSFPTYSISIDRSAGINVGVPVQGIPLAFGLLGSDKATASVTLKDAYSYGLDEDRIWEQFEAWWKKPEVNQWLRERYSPAYAFDPLDKGYHIRYSYLRVITRVYLVGSVKVSVVDASNIGGDIKGGLTEKLTLINNQEDLLNVINKGIAGETEGGKAATTQPSDSDQGGNDTDTTPAAAAAANGGKKPAKKPATRPTSQPSADDTPVAGGRVKFTQVTDRSVSLDETFDRPLVIGYLAYDVPIGFGGEVGKRPVATQTRLRSGGIIHARRVVDTWVESDPRAEQKLSDWIEMGNRAWLAERNLPTTARGLIDHIENQHALNWLGASLFPSKLTHDYTRLYRRIQTEVIETPEGITPPSAEIVRKLESSAH